MQHVTRTIPMMDAYEFVKLQAEMYPSYMTSSNGGYLMEWEGKKWKLDDYRNIDQYNWQMRFSARHSSTTITCA